MMNHDESTVPHPVTVGSNECNEPSGSFRFLLHTPDGSRGVHRNIGHDMTDLLHRNMGVRDEPFDGSF